ncbi:ABC transporter substrate-binding protein [Sporosarcina sp. Te-1]|uniref:ABC transporter substrate-binding protein n=1 Tax=Sporosarcina sp. Te-1 TaxID=2818390 RepID=UPI001A9EC89B|nr:ABC transporter substrate-binding protein [Sporosarcina sp. Te-1]QTD42548.1 SgrR family transcriptional regulator [Sporosarcina sp. Te-1]
MRYVEHLLTLDNYFEVGCPAETTVALLAGMLNCSERHVKNIMNALHDEQVIHWATARGRGKKPRLTLLLSKDDILMAEARRLVETDRFREAFLVVEAMSQPGKEEFHQWFTNSLGLSRKREKEEELDTLRYPFYETQLIMDPMLIKSRHDAHMVQQIFDRLLEFDAETGKLLPRIAHHWETTDGKRWTFYIHKGILFHHGRRLTSEDVRNTFERLQNEGGLFPEIRNMTVCHETVIQFDLKWVDYLFPRSLATGRASIIPIEKVKEGDFQQMPIGSGPYQLLDNNENMIQLEVNPLYFSTRPWLDRIEIIKTPAEYERVERHPFLLNQPDSTWKQVTRIEEGASFVVFNCVKDGPFNSKEMRKNIREKLRPEDIRNEWHDNEFRATSFLTKHSLANQAKPKNRLDERRFDGLHVKIAVQQIRQGANHEKAAKLLQAQLQDIGIASQLDLIDASAIGSHDCISTYDLFVGGIALGKDHLISLMRVVQSAAFPIYPAMPKDIREKIDEKARVIRGSREEQFRWNAYYEIEELLSSEDAILFLQHRFHSVYEPDNSAFVNIKLNSNGRVDYRNVWKKWSGEEGQR